MFQKVTVITKAKTACMYCVFSPICMYTTAPEDCTGRQRNKDGHLEVWEYTTEAPTKEAPKEDTND